MRVRWCRTQKYYDQDLWRGTWALDGAATLQVDALSLPGCELLRRHLSDLQDHAADLILAVQSAQLDPLYRKAIHPADWDAEFAEIRERLEGECDVLQRQIRILSRS